MIEINSKEEILDILKNSKAVMLYFGATNCSVCQVLRPKVEMNISLNFSKMKQYYINSNQNLKEFKRYGRNISLDIFNSELKRLYEMVF